MGVFLHTRCRRLLLRLLPCCSFLQPFALWSSGPGSSPGAADPRPGGDTPVGVLFLSRWPPGPAHRGPRTENHEASEEKDERGGDTGTTTAKPGIVAFDPGEARWTTCLLTAVPEWWTRSHSTAEPLARTPSSAGSPTGSGPDGGNQDSKVSVLHRHRQKQRSTAVARSIKLKKRVFVEVKRAPTTPKIHF